VRAGLVAVLCGLTISCATTTPAPPAPVEQVEQDERLSLSDDEFAHLMATHTRAVMDVALLAGGKGKSAEVKAVANEIWESKRSELNELVALTELNPVPAKIAASHQRELVADHRANMTRLKAAKASTLDQLFVEEMLRRNRYAFDIIDQARLEDPATQQLAEKLAERLRVETMQLNSLQLSSSTRR
jgi:uncharacterized protein (DUF305 family)